MCLIGPAGTGKSHTLIALGIAAVEAGHRVRYFTAAELVETLYRGLADNSVGKIIDTLLRNDLILVDELGFAPLDDTGAQLLFRFVAAAYERRSLGLASHWPFESWGRFLPEHTTAVSMLDRLLHHCHTVVTEVLDSEVEAGQIMKTGVTRATFREVTVRQGRGLNPFRADRRGTILVLYGELLRAGRMAEGASDHQRMGAGTPSLVAFPSCGASPARVGRNDHV